MMCLVMESTMTRSSKAERPCYCSTYHCNGTLQSYNVCETHRRHDRNPPRHQPAQATPTPLTPLTTPPVEPSNGTDAGIDHVVNMVWKMNLQNHMSSPQSKLGDAMWQRHRLTERTNGDSAPATAAAGPQLSTIVGAIPQQWSQRKAAAAASPAGPNIEKGKDPGVNNMAPEQRTFEDLWKLDHSVSDRLFNIIQLTGPDVIPSAERMQQLDDEEKWLTSTLQQLQQMRLGLTQGNEMCRTAMVGRILDGLKALCDWRKKYHIIEMGPWMVSFACRLLG
jgi:hypothetical protein